MNDVHAQFAGFFEDERIKPYAYLLSKRMEEGHICIDPLEADAETNREGKTSDILNSLSDLITQDTTIKKPFVWQNERLYLQRYFNYESQILACIRSLTVSGNQAFDQRKNELEDLRTIIKGFIDKGVYDVGEPADLYTDWQMIAAVSAYLNNFTIITGGPGTGKTTTVAKVLSLLMLKNPNLRIALAAPTGKAAVRMGESLKKTTLDIPTAIREKLQNLQPLTIHRLLGYQYESIYFKHNKENPLPFDVIVIDEASMIDVALFSKLISAVANNTRIIFLGDKNQLASVESGSLFGDLCKLQYPSNRFNGEYAEFINSFFDKTVQQIQPDHVESQPQPLINHIIELKRSHRFKHNSKIGQLSRAILENDQTALDSLISNHPYESDHPVFKQGSADDAAAMKNIVMLDVAVSDGLFEKFIDGYVSYIRSETIEAALKAFNKLRILCAVREGNRGLYEINRKVEYQLKQKGIRNSDGSLFQTDKEFYENRPIIVTCNLPELKLSNGDVGIMRKDQDGYMKVWFETPEGIARPVSPAYISGMETVFAMTIHKSQGSEYNQVLMILPDQTEHKLLSAELIYTGVTRAIDNVFVQTESEVLKNAASIRVSRASGIMQRKNEMN